MILLLFFYNILNLMKLRMKFMDFPTLKPSYISEINQAWPPCYYIFVFTVYLAYNVLLGLYS